MTKKSDAPAIRFKGFSDAWEQRKAKELFVSTADKGYPELPVLSATQDRGMIRRDENSINIFHDKKNEAGYKRVLPGQFVIHLRSFQGGFAHSAIEGITSPAYTVFGFSEPEKHDSEYWKYVFTSKSFIRRLETVTYGIRDGRSISYDEFLTLGFVYPSKAEQTAIARYLDKLSDLITLHQRKFEKLTNVKKSMLEKMFPQNSSSYPEIRFKGFTDPWEQRKFSDVVATRRGLTYKPSDIRKNGVRVLRSSNIAEDSFALSDEDVFVVREAVNIDCARANDILITAANGSSRLVGKHTIISGIPEESAVHGGFMLLGTTKEPHFVNASMGSSWYRRFIELFVAGGNGAIGNLNKNDLDNQEIAIPSEEEQEKIGSFFRQLDHLITLHQRELEKLQNIKKSMLEKMFV